MSRMKWSEIAVFPVIIVFAGILIFVDHHTMVLEPDEPAREEQEHIPDFASYTDIPEKKTAFFEFMLPMIRKANASITKERDQINKLLYKISEESVLTDDDKVELTRLFEKYSLTVPDTFSAGSIRRLLNRADTVPESLALAQAANESGWGTSRFAREANNYFGIWCYIPGCGLTPDRRDEGKTHQVRRYDSSQASVEHYLQIINTQSAYRELRQIRAELRNENNLNGLALADGLIQYSERGPEYVRELKQMIRFNKLAQYTLDRSA